jgi:branched-chain amino acid transport system substrate-binding protein
MRESDRFDPDRRDVLKAVGGAGALGLTAGCVSTGDETETETQTPTQGGDGGDGGDGGGDTETETTGDGGTDEPYTIGMIDSLTGSLSAFGERNQRGKDLALSRINDVGIGGRQLEVQVEDSESDQQAGVSAAQNLVNQAGVPFIVGAVGSGTSLSIYESVVQDTDVVQLSQNSTGLGLTEFSDLLRVAPSGRSQAIAISDLVAGDGYDQVALTYVNNNFGQSLADAFEDAWDGEIAFESPHNQEEQSYTNLITQMADSGAEAWVFFAYQQGFTTMVNDAYEGGYAEGVQFYGGDAVRGESVLENTPEGSMNGMKIVEPSAPINQDNYQEFSSAFQEEYDREPTAWAAYAYDAVVVAALSILATDEFTGAALSEVVRDVTRPEGQQVSSFADAAEILGDGGSPSDVDYRGVSGPIDLDENGDPKGFLQVFEVQDHSYEGVDFIAG